MSNAHYLSAEAARTVQPNTFRTAIVASANGVPVGVAMHLTFADPKEQGLIAIFALAALPSIIEQLQQIKADTAGPETPK